MCRFAAYIGKKPILMSEIIYKPENSLINQSNNAKESSTNINADGFGISWYDRSIDEKPGIFRSIQPAWNDRNLLHLTNKIKTKSFLAHIRASTVGDVTLNNCHPFAYEQYSLVHNGTVRGFEKIRRRLINELDEEIFSLIKAQTDSEHLFFLIINFLIQDRERNIETAIRKAFNWVSTSQVNLESENYSKLNIVLTDGISLIATRFATKNNKPLSLYYTQLESKKGEVQGTIIASEPLTNFRNDWHEVPENHYIKTDIEANIIKIQKL